MTPAATWPSQAWSSPALGRPVHRPPISFGTFPAVSVGVPTVLPGLDEALYREAEARRQRQAVREEEAWVQARAQSRPRLGRHSRSLCQGRLERELLAAFEANEEELLDWPGLGEVLVAPGSKLRSIFEAMDFLSGSEEEDVFCSKLGLLLDKEEFGKIRFDRLLGFLCRAFDRNGPSQAVERPGLALTLEEECFSHLEMQLNRAFGRMLPNRLSKPKAELLSRRSGASSRAGSPTGSQAQSISPTSRQPTSARTPSPTRRSEQQPWRLSAASLASTSNTPAATLQRPNSARRTRSEAGGRTPRDEGPALSRCHLLYHQAIFAAREGAQLEEEIKALKKREEMRECTFRPKLLPPRRPASPKTQPRNFESTVARMREAHKRRLEKEQERERIPVGENYERLRRLGTQPFSCFFKDRGATRRQPLVYVDVNVGHGRTGRIGVYEGDNLRLLAKNFAKAFQLDRGAQHRLEELLQQAYDDQMQGEDYDEATFDDGLACREPGIQGYALPMSDEHAATGSEPLACDHWESPRQDLT
mmetsp:Transcript_18799/g.33404  ORF Transcript_18799/g.33404 Transcript_18799/m.33404 type:complete len:533 (+) Transcript_18799:65-1663(+)